MMENIRLRISNHNLQLPVHTCSVNKKNISLITGYQLTGYH